MITIQQAAANALAAYLRTKLTDVDIQDRWPDPDCNFVTPRITILPIGPRQDTPIDVNTLDWTAPVNNNVAVRYQIAACEQDIQLDIWATSSYKRDDILARLDDALNCQDPVNLHGLLLPAITGDGWDNSNFDYYFESPALHDSPFTSTTDEFRATYMGHMWFTLTVTRQAALQQIIHFQNQLSATGNPATPIDTINIT